MVSAHPIYVRRDSSELGFDVPGLETVSKVAKATYYVGIGTALIVGALFAWRVIDAISGE